MGFFSAEPKKVSKEEMREIMQNLYGKLDREEREEVEKLFRADLFESGLEKGISQSEFDSGMRWLEANPSKHKLEANDIAEIKKYFGEHLKD